MDNSSYHLYDSSASAALEEKSNGNGYQKYLKGNSAFDLGGYTVDLTSALFSFFFCKPCYKKKTSREKSMSQTTPSMHCRTINFSRGRAAAFSAVSNTLTVNTVIQTIPEKLNKLVSSPPYE